MATAQPVSITLTERKTLSPRSSPRASPRASPRSQRHFTLKQGRSTAAHHSHRFPLNLHSESSTPYYHSFKEAQWLAQLLAELVRKDSELLNLLRANRAQHKSKFFTQEFKGEEQKQAVITSYQDFLASLVSLIAQSVFLEDPEKIQEHNDPHGVVPALCGKRCPALSIFCRLAIDPTLIASARPDDTCTGEHNGIPVNQLARFCDIAILQFLNKVNEHTKPQAVLWAVDYMSNLLNSLISSIANHNSLGWYGAPSTRQKKPMSVNAPRVGILPQAPPTVVVVGSPPPVDQHTGFLDPVTGQPSLQSEATPFQFPVSLDGLRQSPQSLRNSSLSESRLGQDGARLSPREGSISDGMSSPVDRIVSPSWSGGSGSPMLSPHRREGGANEPDVAGMFGRELLAPSFRPRSPRLAEIKIDKPQSIPEEEEEEREREEGGVVKRRAVEREGKQKKESVLSHEGNSASFSFKVDVDEGEGGGEVRKKPSAAALQGKSTPNVDIKKELKELKNAEGRISLIAILQAIASLPQSDDIWTEKFGTNCFQLIQHCMNLGLTHTTKAEETTKLRRKRFQKQENVAFHTHGQEHPCRTHSKYVVHFAVHALIQCATNLLVGCSHDSQLSCRLAYKQVSTQSSSIHSRVLRHLKRIHLHSPQEFQRVMMRFSASAPLRKLLHFLHVVLEYCQPAYTDNVDSLLLSIVSSVLRILIDRLAQLDLTKPSLRENCLPEVCLFFQHAHTLFSFHTQLDSYRHFHMYIHRVALSVVFPQQEGMSQRSQTDSLLDQTFLPFPAILEETETLQESPVETRPSPAYPSRGTKLWQSLPRRTAKQMTIATSEEKARPHSSIQSEHVVVNKSPKVHRKGIFTKQHSIHEQDNSTDIQMSGSEITCYMEEWRRLKLKVLRHRIQRLVVLMDLCEPGTVPNPGMLASLIDLSDGTLVVARAMVFLECALFVSGLRDKENRHTSHWLLNKKESQGRETHHVSNKEAQNIAIHLKKWAVAIGEKLRIVELRERDMIQRLRAKGGGKDGPIVLPEEPVLPDGLPESGGQKSGEGKAKFQTVSFSIKMCACILLNEITHYLRDNTYTPSLINTPRVSITNLGDRRPSVISTTSTDTEAVVTPSPVPPGAMHLSLDGRSMLKRPLSYDPRSGSFEEDAVHGGLRSSWFDEDSFGETSLEVPPKQVSVYLRVDSAIDAVEGARGRGTSALKQTVSVKSNSNQFSPKRRSSVSASVGSRHISFRRDRNDNSLPRGRTSAVTVGAHRPLPGKQGMKLSHSFQDYPDSSPSESMTRPGLQKQGSTASQKSPNLGVQIQNGISRLATRARAFRGKIRKKPTVGPRKTSMSGSSPNLTKRKRPQRLSQSQVLMTEDDRHFFPWLEIVEHLVVVDALNPKAHSNHARACKELVTALDHVYAVRDGRDKVPGARNLSSLFAGAWGSFIGTDGLESRTNMPSTLLQSKRRLAKAGPPVAASTGYAVSSTSSISTASSSRSSQQSQQSQQSLASLDFSQVRTGVASLFSTPSSTQGVAIEIFLEQDAALSKTQTNASFSKARKSYIQESFAGLMHAPFSLLVYSAPILLPGSLKQVAWDTILDRNQELAQAAGCFFLLAAAKEGESVMKDFFSKSVVKASAVQQREAVLRFMALWRFRYKVWPAVGEKGQKKFNAEREQEEGEDQQTIGYSLPANLLGSDGRDVPVAPWTALSICVHPDCKTNPDKCYRATRLAPLKHCKEVSESVESFSVSGISLPLEADSKPTSVFAGVGNEDNAGNININQWEAIEPTLFPPSLLPLINFVITSLTPHSLHTFTSTQTSRSSFNQQSLSKSELAYQAVKQCMVEDPRLLFRPLLNGFNKLYQEISDKKSQLPHTVFIKSLKDTLHPLHSILQAFSVLPPKAAHFLFNNFVGIITRHTDQPCAFSAVIIQSVLVLLTMVIPSVQGLDLKALKCVLKKESCYTTILTTARIRGAEKIQIVDETFAASTRPQSSSGIAVVQGVDPDDTFGHVIARVKGVQLSYDLLQNLYLVDQSKDLPVLSTLVVKDHYSMLSDRQYPTFALREAGRGHGREAWSWGDQLNQLFVHKMSEALRVLMSVRLLSTGPDVERGSNDIYNKFAQPNYRFLHQELVALNSFPRQALTSILYEAGSATLTQHHLRSSDSMLIGTWVKFILDFFIRVKTDYDWANSMALFLNVVNGALLLYSEDSAILRQGVASLVIAASKFVHVFRKNGYEMVVPTIVQVYASHINNKLITDTLKFIWGKFYLLNLDSNVFLLQAIAATATLLSEEAAKLSTTSGTPLPTFLHSQQTVVAQHNHARAVFQLMKSLESETAPPDHLHVMGCCPVEQEPESPWQPLTLQTTFYLCITLASWNPEAVRGMQVLVFLDHLIPMFLKEISSRVPSTSLDAMRLLVKGCDAITKPQSWKGDFLSRRETQRTDTQQNLDMVGESMATTREPRLHPPERKPSTVAKIYRRIVNPSKGMDTMEGSGYFSQTNLDKAVSTLPPIGHQEYVGEFKRRVQATNQRVLQLSRVSLLSLASKFVSHESTQMRERSDHAPRTTAIRMDAQTTVYLTTIAVQLLKLGGTNEVTLTSQGLCCFMESLLPNIEWSDAHLNSFHSVISRLVKLFRTLCRVRIILAWDSLGLFLRGVTECIRNSPQLAAHEPNFTKLKTLLEVIVNAPSQGGGGGGGGGQEGSPSQNRGGQRRPLLHFAPNAFNDVVVGLISQLIVTTKNTHNPRLRYRLSDLLSQKLSTKDALLPKILLPLCIHLGLREDLEQLPQEDLDFLLQLLDKKVENTLKLSRPPLHPSHFLDASRSDIPADMFFRAIKVFSCAFSGSFTLQDWSRVSQWVMSLSLRKLEGPQLGPGGRLELTGGSTSSLAISSRRSSRHSSVSSVTGQHNVDSYLAFYKALLVHIYESLLSVYRIPLFSFLWPILGQLEAQLSEAEKCVKIENPAQLQGIRSCIEKCQKLRRQSQHLHTTKSKNSLLVSYQEEMRTPVQHQFKRSSTTVDRKRPRHALKKRLSYQHSLPSIGEEDPKGKGKDSRDGASRKGSKAIDSRPTFLKFSSPPPQQETRAKKAAVVLKEEDVKKKTRFSHDETASKTGTSYSSSDAATPKPSTAQPVQSSLQNKSAMRKYPTDQGKLSPLSSPPAVSPRVKRKPRKTVSHTPRSHLTKPAKRHPPLGELRNDSKFTSSEFQADVEDFDAISPLSIHDDDDDGNNRVRDIETSTTATSRAGFESESTTNRAVLERERDESTTHGPYTVTLQAEVHFDSLLPESSAPTTPVDLLSPSAHSPSLIPPPPSPRPSSRSASYSPVPSSTCSPLPSPSLFHPPSPLPHLPPPAPTSTTDTYSQDLDCSIDRLLPRDRTGSSPPPSLRDNSSHGETSPYDTETDTETLLLHPSSSRSSGSRKGSSSPTTRKKLSFDRRQGSSKDSSSGSYYINMHGLERESDC